jgi:hypothetical protein
MRAAAAASVLVLAWALATPSRVLAFEQGSPEDVVARYLAALKDGKFDVAFDLVSAAMKQGKDHDAWVKEQKDLAAFADVKIFDFKVQTAKVEGAEAKVPNILSSQDRFVNTLGLTEYEIYTLVKEDGKWKVDSQILVEPPDMPKWFPDVAAKTPQKPGDH